MNIATTLRNGLILAVAAAVCLAIPATSDACTGLRVRTKDGAAVHGRTLEFGTPLDSHLLFVPRGLDRAGSLPDGKAGKRWTTTHAAVGMCPGNIPGFLDGMNDAGLSVGLFYFPGFAEYTPVTAANSASCVAPHELSLWALTACASTAELRKAIEQGEVQVCPTALELFGGAPPMHLVAFDKDGTAIVIEPVGGKLVVHDNPLGVLTNSPTFDWHMTNLRNYASLSTANPAGGTIQGVKITPFGQGSGLCGIPGDFSPPARFVRAAFYSSAAAPSADLDAAVGDAFHMLNNFDIPDGTIRETDGKQVINETTQFTCVRDPSRGRFYWKTYQDQTMRYVELASFDQKSKAMVFVPLPNKPFAVPLKPLAR